MPTGTAVETTIQPTVISFKSHPPTMSPQHTKIIPGQGVVFTTEKECILYFDNYKVFNTHCVWLAPSTTTVLYPVAPSERTSIWVKDLSGIKRDGPNGDTG